MLDERVAREVTARYVDPLAQVWLAAARRIGLKVVRTPDAYAATDGKLDMLICVGDGGLWIAEGCRNTGFPAGLVQHYPDAASAAAAVAPMLAVAR